RARYGREDRILNRRPPPGLSPNDPQVNAVLTARDGTCWMAGGRGLLHLKNPKMAPEEVDPPVLAGLNVTALAEDKDGGLWAGTREGEVWRVPNGRAIAHTNLWQAHAITSIVPDSDGTLWIGTEEIG